MLIGNLTRDPELRYTPAGTAVCSFGLATNRAWTTESGEKKEETEFHRIVSWNKLAELCSQLLVKGRKVFVEGRLQTRSWQTQDGTQRTTTEIVIDDMIILDPKRMTEGYSAPVSQVSTPIAQTPQPVAAQTVSDTNQPTPTTAPVANTASVSEDDKAKPGKKSKAKAVAEPVKEDINPDDIPF